MHAVQQSKSLSLRAVYVYNGADTCYRLLMFSEGSFSNTSLASSTFSLMADSSRRCRGERHSQARSFALCTARHTHPSAGLH